MITFNYKGISIEASTEIASQEIKEEQRTRIRFDKITRVYVSFFEYTIDSGNLNDLAFAKACTQYFLQSYWKRNNKQGCKIDLAKTLLRDGDLCQELALNFTARQKDNKHYLQISLQVAGATLDEVYLDGQEVIMLDISLGKAISLLTPKPLYTEDLAIIA
jgi:hypothetical protein